MKEVRLIAVFSVIAAFLCAAMLAACDNMPAAKINPNATDGDEDGSESGIDGDSGADGDSIEADGDNDGNDTSQLPLDVVLDATQVRAGIITNPDSELIPGEKAQGRAGDYKIYNNRAAFIIQGGDHTNGWRGVSGSGGTVLDAAALDENGIAADDKLMELWPAIEMDAISQGIDFGTYRNFKIEKIELINNGSNGKAAVIKVSGSDWGSPLADRYSKLLSAPPNPQVKLFIYYMLDPDSDYLRMEIRAKQSTDDDSLLEVVTLGAGILTDSRQETYYFGYHSAQEPAYLKAWKAPALARFSYASSYMLSCGAEEELQIMKFDERPYYATCAEQLKVENGGVVVKEMRFYVSEKSPDALLKSIYSPEETEARIKGMLSLPGALKIEDIFVAARDFETDRLLSVSFPYENYDVYFYEFNSLPLEQNFYLAAYSRIGGEGLPTSSMKLQAGEHIDNIPIISPAAPADIYVSVTESTSGGTVNIPARLDFYIQSDYEARKTPYFTTYISDTTQPEHFVAVPMKGAESRVFTIVASAGLFHSIDVKTGITLYASTEQNEGEGEYEIHEFTLKQVVDLGQDGNLPPDGDADPEELESESETENVAEEEPESEISTKELRDSASPLYVPLAAGLLSDSSLDNFTPLSESLEAALAAGYRAVAYADACTITDAASLIENLGYGDRLSAVSGMNVKTPLLDDYSQSGYTTGAFGITAPEDAEQYFDIPGFYYSDYDGGFSGISPPPGAWDALRSDYSAVLIHQPELRGNGDGSGILERFGVDGAAYDPYIGKDSLDSLIGDYLAQWNSVSLLPSGNDFIYLYYTLADWASLLNQGYNCTATFGNDGDDLSAMGYPVNLLVLDDNEWNGAAGALSAALKKHRNIIVAGPTIQISIADALPGDTYKPEDIISDNASLTIHLKVSAPLWVPFNFAMIVQNGQVVWPPKNFNFPGAIQTFEEEGYRVFEQDISIPLPPDTAETPQGKYKDFWLAAIALTVPTTAEMKASANGENLRESAASYTLFPVYPEAISFGLANPIWVDANGNDEFDEPGVLSGDTPYLQNSELCAVIIAHDNQNLTGARDACCTKYPTATYCNP